MKSKSSRDTAKLDHPFEVVEFKSKTGLITVPVSSIEGILENEDGSIIETGSARYFVLTSYKDACETVWPKAESNS